MAIAQSAKQECNGHFVLPPERLLFPIVLTKFLVVTTHMIN